MITLSTPAGHVLQWAGWRTHYSYPDGTPIGKPSAADWLWAVPRSLADLLRWVDKRYIKPEILVTENGVCVRCGLGWGWGCCAQAAAGTCQQCLLGKPPAIWVGC